MSKRRFRRQKLPSEPVLLDITSLSHEGRGIAHIEGKVAFVDGALAGERVLARYIRKRSKLDELKAEEIHTQAEQRVEPACSYAGQCGGCSLQHMDPKAQLELKQSVLLEHIQHAAGLGSDSFQVLPILEAAKFHYRRKARLAVRVVAKKGGALVGFREKYSSFITDMNDCEVLVEEVATLIAPLREMISTLGARYVIPQIEVAVGEVADGSDELEVALVLRHLEKLAEADMQSLQAFAHEQRIHLYLQPGNVDSVHKIFPAESEERLRYYLPDFGLQLNFHPMDFTQINAEINRLIIDKAIELLVLDKSDIVLDLFCGLGNFTLPVATLCQQVIGIEGSEEMVKRGAENARLNNLTNAEFFAANLCDSFADKAWAKTKFTKILLDPPRSGAIEIITQIAKFRAEKIVYISCNPATLARDTAELTKHGYSLKSAGVMDMFPHTTHVESMAEFVLQGG